MRKVILFMLPLAFGLASNPSNAQTIALINKLNKKKYE